jgi:hypothetical protein
VLVLRGRRIEKVATESEKSIDETEIGLFHVTKIRLPEIWQRMICLVFSVYMAKAIRNLSGFNKKNLVFLIRNISSKELHSALGKISVVNLMYNLLGLKNCFGLKI